MQLRIIDGNSLGFSLSFVGKKANPENREKHALRCFLENIRSRLKYQSDIVNVVAWDGHAAWRHEMQEGYKGARILSIEQREALESFEAQRPLIQTALQFFPVIQVTHPGAEAQDVAYGLSRQLVAQGHLVDLATASTDWLGLVSNRVRWGNIKKITEVTDLANFKTRTGLETPRAFLEAKALAGDTDLGLTGLPGSSATKLRELLTRHKTLNALLSAAEDLLSFGSEAKQFHGLTDHAVQARIRRNLLLIDSSQGPKLKGEDLSVAIGELCAMELCDIFYEQGLSDYLREWGVWEKAISEPLRKSDVLTIQRAILNISNSWPEG